MRTKPQPSADVVSVPDEPVIVAQYEIGEALGRGPLGTVYRARHVQTGEKVVFRGFSVPTGADTAAWNKAKAQFREFLEQHRRVASHTNIQKIINFGEEGDLFWIASEFFEGTVLHQALQEGKKSLPWVLSVFRQVANAVDFAGERGVTHSDLTPFNILLIPEGPDKIQVKVINFGLAHGRAKFGSPYAAPEQMGGIEGDRRADVYALGALIYHALSGRVPFEGDSAESIARQVQTQPPLPLVGVSPHVQATLARMLAKNPDLRFRSAREAMDALANLTRPDDVTVVLPGQEPSEAVPTGATTTDGDRFRNLELEDAPAAVSSAAQATIAAAATERVALQGYRLSDQDLVEQRKRLAALRHKQAFERVETKEEKRNRGRMAVKFGAFALVPALLLWHASGQGTSYQSLTVAGVTGKPTVARDGATSALNANDALTIRNTDDHPVFTTGPKDTLILRLRGARLRLLGNSQLSVKEMAYRGGAIRRFVLTRGQVVASVDPRRRGGVFEIDSFDTRAIVKGTLFSVTASGSAKNGQVSVATARGTVRVVQNYARQMVEAGEEIVVSSPGGKAGKSGSLTLPAPDKLDDGSQTLLSESAKAFDKVPGDGPLSLMANVEESLLAPVSEAASNVAHLPTYINDQRAVALSMGGMQALCTLVMTTDGGDGLPASVNLSTIAEFGMKEADRKRILTCFEGGKLISYTPLPNGGYEMIARANDSHHTLIRGCNGAASLVGNDDTATLDAAFDKLTKAKP